MNRVQAMAVVGWASVVLGGDLAGASLEPAVQLRLRVPDGYRSGLPTLVQVELLDGQGQPARAVWDAAIALHAVPSGVTLSTHQLTLRNGRGSAQLTLTGDTDVDLTATWECLSATRTLWNLDAIAPDSSSGVLPAGETRWAGVRRVTGDLTVPQGSALILEAGTLVLIDGAPSGTNGTSLFVHGRLEVRGTAGRPVTLTATNPSEPWGEIRFTNAQPSRLEHALILRGGRSQAYGHTGSGPVIRADGTTLTLTDCAISDLAGKVLAADHSRLRFERCLMARATMGPEFYDTSVTARDSWFLEMAGPNDNDGIYVGSALAGELQWFKRCVFAVCTDDAVDQLDARTLFEDCIMRDAADKGISFGKGSNVVSQCLIVSNAVGIAIKGDYVSPGRVIIDRSTIIGRDRGLAVVNKYNQPMAVLEFFVMNSIVRATEHPEDSVYTDYDPVNIRIAWSNVGEPWPGEGISTADPGLADPGTNDYGLRRDSPGIDAGDPKAALDPDGTRADVGRFPFLRLPEPAQLFAPRRGSDGRFELFLAGAAGREYALERTSDLAVWGEAGRVRAGRVPVLFTDDQTAGRFSLLYRARGVE